MEEHNYKWFLHELAGRKLRFPILDTVLCSGEVVTEWYSTDSQATFKRNPHSTQLKIKHLMNFLLEARWPMVYQYNPNKIICIIYREESIKVLTAKNILEIPSTRVYSMKIRSVHAIPFESPSISIYQAMAVSKGGEVYCSFKILITVNRPRALIKSDINLKVKELTLAIGDFIHKGLGILLNRIIFDLVIDGDGNAYLLKIYKLIVSSSYKPDANKRSLLKTSYSPDTFKTTESMINSAERALTPAASHVDFLELLAKTIDKSRHSEYKKKGQQKLFGKSKGLSSLDELLEEIEDTRPKVWQRDLLLNRRGSIRPGIEEEAKFKPERKKKEKTDFKQVVLKNYKPTSKETIFIYKTHAENRKKLKQNLTLITSPKKTLSSFLHRAT